MESPVRICLGAVLVVTLLLLKETATESNETVTTEKNERSQKNIRFNNTLWNSRNRSKLPDVALNELNPKSNSEENTEKNAKYKDRGKVKFSLHSKPLTVSDSPVRRTTTTEVPKILIVTPTPEVKKPAQIIDSMHNYKKNKLPLSAISSTSTTVSVSSEKQDDDDDDDDDKEEDDNDNDKGGEEKSLFDEYTSDKFHANNFFSFPSFDEDNFKLEPVKKSKFEYSTPSFSFSSFFPKEPYTSHEKGEPYKSESFFDFDSDLTTPKNDFFDKKYQEVSSSILNHLNTIKAKLPPSNKTKVNKIMKENLDSPKLNNSMPTNKSSVYIKNTKEIRFLDNEKAGSANKALSDVQGTSIYYEMTVLSTETYNINEGDECENETLPLETTSRTLFDTKPTESSVLEGSTKSTLPEVAASSVSLSTMSSNYLPVTIYPPIYSSISNVPTSHKAYISSTERPKIISSNYKRNRGYSKRLNLKINDSLNSVTSQPEQNPPLRIQTHRLYQTTPRVKPIWLAPRKQINRTVTRLPLTIYSEHFDIKDKFSTALETKLSSNQSLTTSPSEIDPVLQSDVSGTKKIVSSASISDNTIPSLWKRGSTKFSTSSTTSSEVETGFSELEIPPTLTAWALASLRSPPPSPSSVVNATRSTLKTVDENELQKVGEVVDKKEMTTTSALITTTFTSLNKDIISKNVTEINQNKLPWKPILSKTLPSELEPKIKTSESVSERLPTESSTSVHISKEPIMTENIEVDLIDHTTASLLVPESTNYDAEESKDMETSQPVVKDTIPPVDATKSTGFESITKLPSSVTTPKDEVTDNTEEKNEVEEIHSFPTTTDYEVTTIRFFFIPTEEVTDNKENDDLTDWQPIFPTRTKPTSTSESVITTYRPKYITTTGHSEEITMNLDTTTSVEVSTEITENITHKYDDTTFSTEVTQTTQQPLDEKENSTEMSTQITMQEQTESNPLETTTIIVSVETEINTEKGTTTSMSTTSVSDDISFKLESSSEENSDSNEVIMIDNKLTLPPTTEMTTKLQTTTPHGTTELKEYTTVFKEPTTSFKDYTTEPDEHTAKILSTDKVTTTTQQTSHIVEATTTQYEPDAEVTASVTDLEGVGVTGEVTTEASSRVLTEEVGSGAAIAIAVSTIGVIALVLLIGLLLVVRRRGRRGIYAQRCTPVSLDAYSLDSVSIGHRKGNHRLRASKRSYGNPAYDDEVTSHPMNFAALANFAIDVDSIISEFSEIPSVTVRPEEVPPGCEDKNRYSNVLPLPETRVPLKRIGNDPTTEYINANYVTGPGNIRNYYILCQAPLSNTVVDFWRMIWEQNSRVIVMLTEYMENGVEKCYEYLPPSEISDNKRTFGHFQIILKKREQRDKYAISSIQLINLVTRTWREVTQLWYFWPAKGVPDDYDSVIDFLFEMRSYMKVSQTAKEYDEDGVEIIYEDQNRSSYNNLTKLRSDENGSGNGLNVYSPAKAEEKMRREYPSYGTLGKMKAASEVESVRPCVVVCASGAGRSAALVAADECARALAAGRADLPRAVRRLRTQRPHSITNKHHYIFLYKLLSEYGNKLMGGGVDTI